MKGATGMHISGVLSLSHLRSTFADGHARESQWGGHILRTVRYRSHLVQRITHNDQQATLQPADNRTSNRRYGRKSRVDSRYGCFRTSALVSERTSELGRQARNPRISLDPPFHYMDPLLSRSVLLCALGPLIMLIHLMRCLSSLYIALQMES